MNQYNFDEKVDRKAFNSSKWDYEDDVISDLVNNEKLWDDLSNTQIRGTIFA